MRGRFAFSVASLTSIERETAAELLAKPPEATFADAIADFKAVAEIKPEWLENLVYLAKSYLANNEKDEAVAVLREAVKVNERNKRKDGKMTFMMREAREMLKNNAGWTAKAGMGWIWTAAGMGESSINGISIIILYQIVDLLNFRVHDLNFVKIIRTLIINL